MTPLDIVLPNTVPMLKSAGGDFNQYIKHYVLRNYVPVIDVSPAVEFTEKLFVESIPSIAMNKKSPGVLPREVGSM